MKLFLNSICGGLILLLGTEILCTAGAASQNRCDQNIQVVTTSRCHSCSLTPLVKCPDGYTKRQPEKSAKDCRYHITLALSVTGCSFECYKDTVEPKCCPGYWGNDCIECPGSAAIPCSNNGVCSDGITGNGTCTCAPGFKGTACEDCKANLYGHTCSNVCSCKNGICDSGVKGTGQCTCLSGYTGIDCDRELPACAALRCGPNSRCIEDMSTGQLLCMCKPGYQGDGTQCTSINPCLKGVCHANAVCEHTGPNQHVCTCTEGYSGDGRVCMPIDPCQTNLGNCTSGSTRCVYDGPGKSHCECLEGFQKFVEGKGCSVKDVCKPDSCHKYATCATVEPGTVDCKCREGYIGNGKICFGNIIQQLQDLNSKPGGEWTGQLSSAITLFNKLMSWPLTSLGPFTVFVPVNKAFKGTSVKTLLANEMRARYLAKLHMVAGEVNSDSLKKGILFYTLTGMAAESMTDAEQIKIRLHGSRKKGTLVETDIFASNGIIHLVDKLMDAVPSTVISEKEENLLQILSGNGKFSQFKSLLEKSNMATVLEEEGPYTLFAPTNIAFIFLKPGYLDFLTSEEGKTKLLELMRNHIVSTSQLSASFIVSNPRAVTMADQVLTFNVTSAGQILVNGESVLELDVEAKNGRLHSLEGLLIPPSIEPIIPHRCDIKETNIYKGSCVSCTLVSKSTCPTGESLDVFTRGCVFKTETSGISIPTLGCSLFCNETKTTPRCCKGFFGPDCSPCPGGFTAPCSSHGMCSEGIDGNGTCQCEPSFKGSRCQYCADSNKYGPFCDKTCGCIHGMCDNRPEASGKCKQGSCKEGYTGEFCEQQTQLCGPNQPCHAHANCVSNKGAFTCVCKPGFQGDGYMCVESDPCALPHRGGCSINAKCIKTGPGTHTCQCLSGWREDGDECQAINNCLNPSRGGCHPNATCIYVGPGQSDCACKNGYHGNGRDCEPVNQCVEQKGGCHFLATCQFLNPGGWQCVCEDGYVGDGKICYGTLAQEVATNPNLLEFNLWILRADLSQLLSETENYTLFVPSAQATEKLSQEDKDFWMTRSNLPSLIKSHIVYGLYALSDLRASPSPRLLSVLKRTLPVYSTNDTTIVAGGKITYGDMAAKNGVIHFIDKVLMPERQMSEGLLEVLSQRADLSLFHSSLLKHNLTNEMEESSGFTVFAPTDSAIREYLSRTGKESMDLNVTQYHIIINETLKDGDLVDGLYKDTMLGFSYQLGIFRQDKKLLVNEAEVNVTDIETSKGVIHTVSAVLSIPNNRCDRATTKIITGRCMDCFHPTENPCPSGTKRLMSRKKRCMYSRVYLGETLLTIGCKVSCEKVNIERKCCAGYYGINCEKCPGPEGQSCFANGVCVDGINGTGICQCNQGFNGTACETCQAGKYGIHCDQECKCVNGRCKDGVDGDGSCMCDLGWRGINCNVAITSDMCRGKCHSSANCLLNVVDSKYYCSCAAGFKGNGTYCTAVDACAENNGGCSVHAVCKRTLPGRRICVCHPGYAGDGKVCISINPCLDGNNGGCHADGDCIHTGPNKTACICKLGFSGDGKQCEAINVCLEKSGGCHRYAQCTMTGPLERNCTCRPGFIGDGETCKGTLKREILNRSLGDFYTGLMRNNIPELGNRGPFTVFAPNADAYNKPEVKDIVKRTRMEIKILRYHIVACRALLPEDLMQPRYLTTLTGDILTITYSEDTIYINNKAKVVFSDLESSNGIFHEIDTVLVPPGFQIQKDREQDSTPRNLSDVVSFHGFKTFYKLLEDTDTLKLVMDPINQPVTLFLPTDAAMAALAQEQKDYLYAMHNRDQLAEYLRYHIVRDSKLLPSELIHASSLKTQQGSDLSVACMGEEHIGELYVNHKSCWIVKRNLDFNGGMIYGIDCLLNPPSVGGRCDYKHTIDFTLACRYCGRAILDCPLGSKPKSEQKCVRPNSLLSRDSGCQSTCTVVIWKPKCCSGYYGRDCLACPGGPVSPCSDHGKCDEDHLGNGTCTCDAGFTGVACELCVDGHFGPDCKACNCTEHGSCDEGPKGTGSCFCEEGWTGLRCENKLADGPVCNPACHEKGVCMENNTCVCKPFYEGDGITCTAANMCKYWNGGCSKDAKCSQKGEKVSCTCLKGFSGDGFVCTPVDPCADGENSGCHEHATCTMTGAGKRKCECKDNYIGDGIDCEAKQLPVNRCLQDNGQCHSDAQCTDLHYEDKTLGVFHYRLSKGTYKLNYTMAQEVCKETEGTIATYTQLSYAQQAGYNLCAAGWLDKARVAYPMSFSNPKCGFGHVGIVDYGVRNNLSETWDTFCYRVKDVKCECKIGYIGDGYSCTGNLLQVLSARPSLSNFLAQILNYSTSASGKEFVNRLSNITIQSTLFVPDNDGLFSNQTLSGRDIEHHLLDGRALVLQALINITHVRTRLGHSLTIKGVPDLQNPQIMTSSGYINDRYVIDSDILASNGVIHVLQGPLKAPPPPPPSIHPAHKAGMGIGVLGLIILIVAAGFVGYNFYTHKTKPFQFHYFKEDEDVNPSESSPNISNPVYDSFPATKEQTPTVSESNEEDKHQVISSGSYDLLQDS
ncbi:stabilin-2-like [Sinocyclocheilus rhinocerous]|uniref:stabilin-2-like n=1 Tax=Sinocyclocheilus rhinocerous TaxID=307959 RepID=UPI0007B97402|nr:PREDICTED: stabilin-2-like [Sinocyclocheilus rhinocerous]